MSKKKKIITSIASYFLLLSSSIAFGATVDMEFIHFLIMISLYFGGYMSRMAFES